ncbi:MAG: hypothetical protein KGY76_02575 [Candidatus Thermoplasmatota archaeon]|nr:hypothetical protein [Candidatus Thermoplasmatota archaeon]
MKRIKYSDSGQSSLLDALIFFAIAMIASLILAFASTPQSSPESEEMKRLYGETTLETYLHSTLNHTSYEHDNETIHLDDKTVTELVVEDLYLRGQTPVENESLEKGIERPLNETLQNLTYPQYYYNFTAWSSGDAYLSFSNHGIEGDEVISVTQDLHTPEKNETYTANLKVWTI